MPDDVKTDRDGWRSVPPPAFWFVLMPAVLSLAVATAALFAGYSGSWVPALFIAGPAWLVVWRNPHV